METAKFFCDFFFNNIWNFIMLLLLVLAAKPRFGDVVYNIGCKDDDKEEKDDEK